LTGFDWKIRIWLGPHADKRPDEFAIQVQAPTVENALVLAFAKYREPLKDLEHVSGFYIEVKNLTIEKVTRSDTGKPVG